MTAPMVRALSEMPPWRRLAHPGCTHVIDDDGQVVYAGSLEKCTFTIVLWEWGVAAGSEFWRKHNA